MLELIARIRLEYSDDEEAALKRLAKAIPDVAPADLRRWREAGLLQHRMLDDSVRYFRREPSNLFRFCDEARDRRQARPADAGFDLEAHLRAVIEAARPGQVEVVPVKHRISYTLTLPPGRAKAGSVVRAWLPYAQEYRQQQEVKLISTSPASPVIAPVGIKDGKVQRHAQRTLYFEQIVQEPERELKFSAVFEYTSRAYYPAMDEARARPLPADFDRQYLAERLPHIAFTADLRRAVKQAVGEERNPLLRARQIFAFVDREIRYAAEEEYAIIPSFSEKALRSRKGDCGIQGTLFITMCRAAGIPARWQSGFQTKPGQINMHDWAEFYVEPWGWLPADPSYGLQKSDDPRVKWFYFGHQDAYRLIVNLDYGSPLLPAKESLRSEPADFQRGEVEIDGRNAYFNEWDYDMKVEYP